MGHLAKTECVYPGLQLRIELLVHLLPLELDLLAHEGLRLLLHLHRNLLADAFALLHQLLLCQHVLVLGQQQIVGQLLLLCLMLLNTGILTLDGQIQLFFFGQPANLEMSALAVPDQVCRHVLEYRVERLHLGNGYELLVRITTRQEVLAKDLILAVRYRRDGKH